MIENIPDLVFGSPVLSAILLITVYAILSWQRNLTYTEYMTRHGIKRMLFPKLDSWFRKAGRPLIREKGPCNSSDEFVTCVQMPLRAFFIKLVRYGFSPHLLATLKVERPWRSPAAMQLIYNHDHETQTEVYVFQDADDKLAVYAHVESSPKDPEGHIEDEQIAGDAKGVVREALE